MTRRALNGHSRWIAAFVGLLTLLGGMTTGLFYVWETRNAAEEALEMAEDANQRSYINRSLLQRAHPDIDVWWSNGR